MTNTIFVNFNTGTFLSGTGVNSLTIDYGVFISNVLSDGFSSVNAHVTNSVFYNNLLTSFWFNIDNNLYFRNNSFISEIYDTGPLINSFSINLDSCSFYNITIGTGSAASDYYDNHLDNADPAQSDVENSNCLIKLTGKLDEMNTTVSNSVINQMSVDRVSIVFLLILNEVNLNFTNSVITNIEGNVLNYDENVVLSSQLTIYNVTMKDSKYAGIYYTSTLANQQISIDTIFFTNITNGIILNILNPIDNQLNSNMLQNILISNCTSITTSFSGDSTISNIIFANCSSNANLMEFVLGKIVINDLQMNGSCCENTPIYVHDNANVFIDYATIQYSWARKYAGAITVSNSGSLNISHSFINNNLALKGSLFS